MPYPDRHALILFIPSSTPSPGSARLALLGVGTIQLRAKDLSDAGALQIVTTRWLPSRARRQNWWSMITGARRSSAGAKHLHLGQEDLADADLKAIRDAGLTLGLSTHDDEELATALRASPITSR